MNAKLLVSAIRTALYGPYASMALAQYGWMRAPHYMELSW